MPVCYNKLWKILIDEGMSKTDLIRASKSLPMLWQSWEKTKMCA